MAELPGVAVELGVVRPYLLRYSVSSERGLATTRNIHAAPTNENLIYIAVNQVPPPPPVYPEVPSLGGLPAYPQPGLPVQQRTNGAAVGSLVAGIAAILLGWLCCLPGPIGGILAIILGRRARAEIRASGGLQGGEGLATAGEVIGWIVTVIGVLGLLALAMVVILIVIGNQTKDVLQNISNGLNNGTQ